MSKIKKSLEAATEVTQKAKEDTQDYLKRLVRAVSDLDDAGWESLTPEAQDWFNEAADLLNKKKDMPSFPDAKDEAPKTRTRATKEAPADELAVGDDVTVTTKRNKTAAGKIIEIDEATLVLQVGDEEVEYQRDRLESIVKAIAKDEAPKSRRKSADDEDEAPAVAEPAVGDEIVAITGKGKEVKGKVIEIDDDLIVVDDGTDELELVPSKLKSLTIAKDEAPKSRRKSAEDDAPARGKSDAKEEDGKPKRTSTKANGGISATARMRELILDDLDAKSEAIAKVLTKEGLQFRPNTLDLVYADVHKLVKLMRERKMIK